MPINTPRARRINLALKRKKMTKAQLAARLDIPEQTITKTLQERNHKHISDIARELEVPEEWIANGENPPPWATEEEARLKALALDLVKIPAVSLVGAVTAGDGLISFEDDPRPMRWKESWSLMLVEGLSAYPVVYPKQYVIVDTDRAVNRDGITNGQLRHNNIVVIHVDNKAAHLDDPQKNPPILAYLKRYCEAQAAPHGYLFASVNSGRDTPYIPHEKIDIVLPVVGVMFEDADKPPSGDETLEIL